MPDGYKNCAKTKPIKLARFDKVIDWWDKREEIEIDGFYKAKKFTKKELAEDLSYNFDQCGYPHEEEVILDPMDLIYEYQEERETLNANIDKILGEITRKLGGQK